MTTKKRAISRPVDGLVRTPFSYEEYLLLSERDKLRLMRQAKKAKRPNTLIEPKEGK